MKNKLMVILGILLLAVLLAACDSSTTAQTNTATTGSTTTSAPAGGPAAVGTPGAQRTRPASATGAQANGTPAANNAAAQATPQATSAAGNSVSVAPTAVPVPVIVMPTPVAAVVSNNTPVTTAPAQTTNQSTTTTAPAAPAQAVAPAVTLADLKGKIIFFSDRDGGYAQLYVMNADGSNQQVCNCSDLLQTIVNTEVASPDKQQFLYVTTVGGGRSGDIQIWRHNNANNTDEPVTGGAPGFPGVDYDPAWSPDSRHIAFVTEVNGADEIYLHDTIENSDVRLTESSGEWYKHPSFSPDGSHIVYWTNVQSAERKQVWIMNLDGSGKTNLSSNAYNDWDPIFVK